MYGYTHTQTHTHTWTDNQKNNAPAQSNVGGGIDTKLFVNDVNIINFITHTLQYQY